MATAHQDTLPERYLQTCSLVSNQWKVLQIKSPLDQWVLGVPRMLTKTRIYERYINQNPKH